MPGEVGVVGRDHDAVGLGLDLAEHERHHDPGEAWCDDRAGAKQQRVETPDCVGVVGSDHVGEALGGES